MQRVKELYEELGAPGQQKLWLEVRKRRIQVTKTQVNEFVSRQGERQVFTQPLPKAEGKTAAEDLDARYMFDVVFVRDLIVVFLVNVFTRKTWAKTVPNKSAASVAAAGKVLIDRLDKKPIVVSTDDGGEYANFSTYLKEKGIGHKVHVADRDVNALAVLDRAVQDVKQRFTRILARTGKGDEKLKLEQAIKGHNNAHHGPIHGSPNEVQKDPQLQFMNLQDNALKIDHNTRILQSRRIKLEAAGAFRKPLEGVIKNPFRRGYDAKWGEVQTVQRVEGSTVVGQDGRRVDIKLVKAVPKETTQTFDVHEESNRQERKREKLFSMMSALAEWLGAREMSLRAAAMHLAKTGPWDLNGQGVEYKQLLRSQGLVRGGVGGLADATRLFPGMFKLTREALYVKRP